MRRGLLFAVGCVAAAAGGCRCDPPVSTIPIGFRADLDTLDFGRVLEGDTKELTVTLSAETRAAVSVRASVDAPFEGPAQVAIPGASQTQVPVRFHAGAGRATGVLALTANGKTLEVQLKGVGVRPPACNPTGPCLLSAYELQGDRCVESPAPDDTPCDPGNECLTQGRCLASRCVGVARSCDDNNKCTSDSCAPDAGCVRTPVQCPPPTALCKVATCDAVSGCGVGDAPDGTPCGAVSCADARLCVSGQCLSVVPPDGTPCGSALACLPPATCQSQACVRPDAGRWLPSWSARVDGVPQGAPPALLAEGGHLYLTVCGVPADGGAADAGEADGGGADGGDGGACALASYTMTGFTRFVTTFDDGQPRRLSSVGPAGVLLLGAGGLSLHSHLSGAAVASLAVAGVHPRGVASLADAGVLLAAEQDDGGAALATWSSAGLTWGAALPGPDALVAVDLGGRAHAWEPGAGVWQQGAASAALASRVPSLAVAQGVAVVGAQHLLTVDAGLASVVELDWSGDGGPSQLLPREVLAADRTGDAFFLRCDDGAASCLPEERSTWVRAFDTVTGARQWDARVLPGGVPTRLVGTALVGFSPGAVATVVEVDFDAGPRAYLQVFALGSRVVLCPLEGAQVLTASAFAPGQLLVLGADVDGGARLEAYALPGVALPTSGWATDDGLGGGRREAP